MGCCLVAALLISGLRWVARLGRPAPPEPFPPAARRPEPGTVLSAPTSTRVGRPVPPHVPLVRPAVAGALVVPVYLGVAALVGTGPDDASRWVRDGLAAAVVAAFLLVPRPRAPRPVASALALAVAGGTWFVLVMVDVHVFGRQLAPVTDAVVHGAGATALLVGLALRRPTTRRPQGALA